MHVVNPHWVSGTRRRCQAIAVLISLQLCLISSVEANHLAVGEQGSSDTSAVEPTWRSQEGTSHCGKSLSTHFPGKDLLSNVCLIFRNALLHTQLNPFPAGTFPVNSCFLGARHNHHFLPFPSEEELCVVIDLPMFIFVLNSWYLTFT